MAQDSSRLRARAERWGDALDFLGEALSLGREYVIPDVIALVPAYLALHMDENAEAAREALETYDARLDRHVKMEARFVLYEAVGEPADLEEARRLLAGLRESAPEEHRLSMVERIPLHRRILDPGTES